MAEQQTGQTPADPNSEGREIGQTPVDVFQEGMAFDNQTAAQNEEILHQESERQLTRLLARAREAEVRLNIGESRKVLAELQGLVDKLFGMQPRLRQELNRVLSATSSRLNNEPAQEGQEAADLVPFSLSNTVVAVEIYRQMILSPDPHFRDFYLNDQGEGAEKSSARRSMVLVALLQRRSSHAESLNSEDISHNLSMLVDQDNKLQTMTGKNKPEASNQAPANSDLEMPSLDFNDNRPPTVVQRVKDVLGWR